MAKRSYNTIDRHWRERRAFFAVSAEAARLWTILKSLCDDHGLFFARPSRVRNECYAAADTEDRNYIDSATVRGLLDELESHGLIARYEANQEPYLWLPDHIHSGGWKSLRFPAPPAALVEAVRQGRTVPVAGGLFEDSRAVPGVEIDDRSMPVAPPVECEDEVKTNEVEVKILQDEVKIFEPQQIVRPSPSRTPSPSPSKTRSVRSSARNSGAPVAPQNGNGTGFGSGMGGNGAAASRGTRERVFAAQVGGKFEDLLDDSFVDRVFRQAASSGVVTDSDAGRLTVFAAAEHAISHGDPQRSPFGLFVAVLFGRGRLTCEDEDGARNRIARHYRGEAPRQRSAADILDEVSGV